MAELLVDVMPVGGFQSAAEVVAAMRAGARELDLEGQSLGDEGATLIADALRSNGTLTRLVLTDNGLTNAGAGELASALRTNSALTYLGLRDNEITDDGAEALAAALEANGTLRTLEVGYNAIGAAGAAALLRRCHHDPATGHGGRSAALTALDLQVPQLRARRLMPHVHDLH